MAPCGDSGEQSLAKADADPHPQAVTMLLHLLGVWNHLRISS